MKKRHFYDVPGVLDHILESYQGIERNERGKKERKFLYEKEDGTVVIGNIRAFTEHLKGKFNLALSEWAWGGVHELLRKLGEQIYQQRNVHGKRPNAGVQKNIRPKERVVSRKEKVS